MTHVKKSQRKPCMTTFHPQAVHLRSLVQVRHTAIKPPSWDRDIQASQKRLSNIIHKLPDAEYRVSKEVRSLKMLSIHASKMKDRCKPELPGSQIEPVAGCPVGTGTPPCRQWLACRAQALQEAGACAAAVAVPLPDRSARAIRLDRREGSLHFVWKPAQSHLMLRQK